MREAELYFEAVRDMAEEALAGAGAAEHQVGEVLEMIESNGIPVISSRDDKNSYHFKPTGLKHYSISLFDEVPEASYREVSDNSDGSSDSEGISEGEVSE